MRAIFTLWIAFVAATTLAASGKIKLGNSEARYLLFWAPTERVSELKTKLGVPDGKENLLGFGVTCSTFEQEKQVPANIHHAFEVAKSANLAVMLHFDFHVDWASRPDLWNWFDRKKPGYNPDNRRNVEWFGWDGPPAKARYLNWGEAQRMPPPMCFTSKAIRAEWSRLILNVIAPTLKKELSELNSEGKGRLFAGILVGSEPTFDNYANTDPETAKLVATDGAPAGQLGYRALLDRGFRKDHPPVDVHQTLGRIIQETVGFWCQAFVNAGLPAGKLYPHVPAGAPMEMTSSPVWSAFNAYSHPGWSTYPVGPLQQNFQLIYDELKKHGNPPWGGVEANVGFPGTLVDWETYLAWHFNHGAVLMGINIGATGRELPAMLEKSAFGPEAVAAYRKFLDGERLVEKPVAEDPQVRIKRKMDTLQAGFKKWQSEGRDPAPIGRYVEERLPALLKAGKLAEAEAVIDEALKRLGHSAPIS